VDWTGRNHLLLNVAKTREMVIDFRRKRTSPQPLCILGEDVAVVEDYQSVVASALFFAVVCWGGASSEPMTPADLTNG